MLNAEGRMRDSTSECGFNFFPNTYKTFKDVLSRIAVYVFKNNFIFLSFS